MFNQVNTYFWDAADTTASDKQCHTIVSSPGYEGTLISHGSRIWNSLNSGPAWNALPPGHSLKFIQLNDEGPTGSFSLQHSWATDPIPTARRAQRLYLYYTPNFVFSEDYNNNVLPGVDCQNSGKTIQLSERGGGILTFNSDRWTVHAWAYLYDGVRSFWGGSPTDQPQLGVTGQGLTMVSADFKGKWWRYEVVYRNLPGPKTIVEVYLKNVTDNTPEFKILDTSLPRIYTDQWGNQTPWTQSQADNLSLEQGGWDMFWDLFRNPQPGRDNCAGAYGFTEFAAAAWDTDAGQRIGAACEVEGGCGGTPAPTPDTSTPTTPTSLSATAISTTQINLSWSASTDNVGVTGYKIYRNGTQIATTAGTTYSNTSLTPSTAYSYTISAYDASGNTSVQSASVSATTQATPVVSTTPVGSWTFDTTDLTTTTAIDRSGLNNTLSLTSTPARITGKVNQALSFDGLASTASCTDASCGGTTKLDMGTSNWTVSAWVKTTATGNIVTKSGFICGGNPDGWTVYISGTGTLQVGLNDSAAGCVFSPSDGAIINNGSWHHVTAVFNRAGNLVRYVDGVQTGTQTSIASLSGVSIDSAAEFRIGSRDATGDSGFLNGAIDEVKVYPRALSLSEIQTLAAAGTPVTDTSAPTISLTAPTPSTTVSGTTVTVSASASDNVGVSGVQFKLDGANLGTEDTTTPYSITWNTTSATNGTHTLTATARDAAGNTTTSTGVSVTVSNVLSDTSPPTTPSGLTATAISTTQINLSWSASTDNVGVTGYKIYRNGTQIATSATNSYSNTGLTASTAYSYTVSAYDAAGNTSVQSASASATTQAIIPPPISSTPTPGPNDTIIFQDDFEGGNLSKWDEVSPSRYSITSVPANIKSGTGALEALIDSTSSGNLGKWYMPGYDEVYVAFDVKFETGFQNMRSDGYGMHFFEQLGNRTDNQWSASGQAGIRPNGTDFFESVVDPNQIYNDPTLRPLHFYTYYPDMTCPAAPALCYGNIFSQTAPESPLTSGAWHRVVFRIKANTVGQKDGAQSLWFDGTQKIDMQNMRWRDTTNLKLNQLRFDFYLPGAIKTEHAWIDNLVAWTPSATYTPPPPPPASTKFSLNDRVQSTATLNVRTTPSTTGTLLGSQSTNALGTIIGGPTNSGGFNWWNVNYDTGVDGWSVEDYLVKYVAPVADTTTPSVSLIAPSASATVSSTITVSASASDNVGVSGVQFLLDGIALAAEDTTSPYTVTWNTTTATNASHILSARARDAAGNQTTSATVTVTVANITTPTPDTTVPTTPTSLTATAISTTQINLSWSAATDNVAVSGYRIYRNGTLLTTTTATSYANTGLTASTAYSYTVSAYDAAGNMSAQSSGASATTQAAVVTPPATPATPSTPATSNT
ncbi:MAG: Ig-like domain-containing protein, partial [bacterium]|nr:Ig-like domain-containing protein [bacterium]